MVLISRFALCMILFVSCSDSFQIARGWSERTTTIRSSAVSEETSSTPSSARYEALRALLPSRGGGFPVDQLDSSHGFKNLPVRDRALARNLVATVARRQGQLDAIIEQCQKQKSSPSKKKKKPNRTELYIATVLRLGAAQILFMRIPAHAAVKETVDLLRLSKDYKVSEGQIKFVNAVLRKLTREGEHMIQSTTVLDNVAPWLVEELNKAWGEERTTTIVEQAMDEKHRYLTVRQKPGCTHEEAQSVIREVASHFTDDEVISSAIIPQGSVKIVDPPPGKVSDWPGYKEGEWWLQDISATLPAIALYNSLSENGKISVNDKKVVDLCSAPGGKTAQLCCYGFDSVTAVEVSKRRSKRLKDNLGRLRLACEVAVEDGTEWTPEAPIDGVLLDAPCSATGTGSRRPDILRKEPDFDELYQIQHALACHSVDNILNVGGVMVYATCSLLPQEGEEQMARLLSRTGTSTKLEVLPFTEEETFSLPGCIVDENGWLRAFPQADNELDGFFVGRVRKVA